MQAPECELVHADAPGLEAESGLEGLDPPKSAAGEDLGRAAVTAIVKLSAAAGHPVPMPKLPKASDEGSGSGTSPLIVIGVPVILLALGGGLAALRRRQDAQAET